MQIKDEIDQGKLVPSETIVKLLRKFLTQEASGRFTLIDGFPRSMDNLNDFIRVNFYFLMSTLRSFPHESFAKFNHHTGAFK